MPRRCTIFDSHEGKVLQCLSEGIGTIFSCYQTALILYYMKRLWAVLTLGLIAFLVIGADQTHLDLQSKIKRRVCRGYTVIADSKGIDCNGDTLRLMRAGGFYQRVP
jgi:hypothetical protein